jgi:hypothetical protein
MNYTTAVVQICISHSNKKHVFIHVLVLEQSVGLLSIC